MLSLEHKKFALEQWFLTHSITTVRKTFKTHLRIKWHNLPSTSSLWSVIKKLDNFGTLCDRRQGKKHSSNECDVRRVKHLYSRKQRISLRVASRKLDISAYRISDILRLRLLKKSYKTKFALRLTESQRKARISACKAYLSKKAILKHVWFSDESWFYADGIAQKKNQYCWALSRDAVTPTETQLVPIKMMVWAAVSEKGLIGPYFFHKNSKNIPVNRQSYQEYLFWFVEELKRRRMLKKSYFMKDRAALHTAISSKYVLSDIFQDRLIGKGFSLNWPPYPLDLTPADFWLWPKLKTIIFSKRNQ